MDETSHPVGGLRSCQAASLCLKVVTLQAQALSNACMAPHTISNQAPGTNTAIEACHQESCRHGIRCQTRQPALQGKSAALCLSIYGHATRSRLRGTASTGYRRGLEHTSHDSLANGEAPADVLPQDGLKDRAVVRPLIPSMDRAGTLHSRNISQ